MKTRRIVSVAAAMALLAAPCWAAQTLTVTETYDGPLVRASWRVAQFDTIERSGGHPGRYLHVTPLDAAEPRIFAVADLATAFLGDYRAKGVSSLGVDVNLFRVDFGADQRPVSLFLESDMGTPSDTSDDCEAVLVGSKNVPRPGSGWKTFDFRVPSQSLTLPQSWVVQGVCAGLSPDEAWNAVITNVTGANFTFGEPGFFYIFQVWDLGFDNPRITMAAP